MGDALVEIARLKLEKSLDRICAAAAGPGAPGVAVAVMRGGEVLARKGYGLASIEHAVPVTPATRFRVASVTKQFTVAGCLLLAREGRLSLDDDIRAHLPELPQLAQTVTVEQMMRNTSGLPDFLELLRLGGLGLDRPARAPDLTDAVVRSRHLNFAPGSRFLYSNTNFLLLGLMIERLSGRSLPDFLDQRIFAPLGMTETRLVVSNQAVVPGLATPYLDGGKGVFRAAHGFPHGGEGGLVSTVDDLLIWSRALDQPPPGFAGIAQLLAEPRPLAGGHPSIYARGQELGRFRGLLTVGHGGLWPGYRTHFLRLPEKHLTVVVIANFGGYDPNRMALEVAAAVLADDPELPPAWPAPDPAESAALAGEWLTEADGEPVLFAIEVRDGALTATQNGIPFGLAPRGTQGWLVATRGAFEFAIRPLERDRLSLDLGAGRSVEARRLAAREPAPEDIAGTYAAADIGARWRIETAATGHAVAIAGPLVAAGEPWPITGVARDLVEIATPSAWLPVTQLARLSRDAAGRVTGFELSTGRVKRLPFARVSD